MTHALNTYVLLFLALIAGMVMPTQAALNNRLAGFVETPVLSALISFAVGTAALLVYILATGVPMHNLLHARNAPSVLWMGGVLGAFFVTCTIFLVPRIGVAMTFSLVIAGQMFITLFIDHFGFMGAPEKAISHFRVFGAALIVFGVVLIRKF
jgi:bacterial/archaeal transporter family-2 protein